jgi:hypothetical protein
MGKPRIHIATSKSGMVAGFAGVADRKDFLVAQVFIRRIIRPYIAAVAQLGLLRHNVRVNRGMNTI